MAMSEVVGVRAVSIGVWGMTRSLLVSTKEVNSGAIRPYPGELSPRLR
jgi:hypothetical protein